MTRLSDHGRRSGEADRFFAVRWPVFLFLSGLLSFGGLTAVIPTGASAEPTSSDTQALADPYGAHIAEASQRFGLPEHWIHAVMRAESDGIARAVSSAGAMGLMQIMPGTWDELRARYGLGSDPFDPRDNILAGTAYLRELHDRYGAPGFLAAYNAGPARYDEYLASGRALPAETRAFVAALAPHVDADNTAMAAATPAINRNDWTHAPLFVAQLDGSRTTVPLQSDEQPNGVTPAPTTQHDARMTPQSSGLFVAQSRPDERR